jgi:SAM-dependent methyltransferase
MELATLVKPTPGTLVVDVGSGLGGTARYLASEHNCQVTGLDLTNAYCRLAGRLSGWVGLSDRTEFRRGDALSMPFDDGIFDLAWTEHVQMNIADKIGFYREIHRVLRSGGRLAFHDIFAGDGGETYFPVPWAASPSISALARADKVRELLASLGFSELAWEDRTPQSVEWFRSALVRSKEHGRPPLGIQLLLGEDAPAKLQNILRNLEERRVVAIIGLFERA